MARVWRTELVRLGGLDGRGAVLRGHELELGTEQNLLERQHRQCVVDEQNSFAQQAPLGCDRAETPVVQLNGSREIQSTTYAQN